MKAPLPTFLIIGAQKSATRWLRVHLGHHPDVMTAGRELEFFNHHFDKGGAWYSKRFADWEGEQHIGEATPGYMMWNESPSRTAGRIDGFLPGVKLFALLRNPVDRAYSAFVHHMVKGRVPPSRSIVEHLDSVKATDDDMSIISGGWYAASLEPYVRRFGERLQILVHEDVSATPDRVYAAALRHLGLDPGFVPPELAKVLFSNTPPGSSAYAAGDGRRNLSDNERSRLADEFRSDVARLRSMVDVDLSIWGHDFPG